MADAMADEGDARTVEILENTGAADRSQPGGFGRAARCFARAGKERTGDCEAQRDSSKHGGCDATGARGTLSGVARRGSRRKWLRGMPRARGLCRSGDPLRGEVFVEQLLAAVDPNAKQVSPDDRDYHPFGMA